jgi:hypothetical protein
MNFSATIFSHFEKTAAPGMVRHLRRELSRQRLAEFNLPLEWKGKADAKSVCCAQRDNALGRIGRLLDDPRRERVRIVQALVLIGVGFRRRSAS